MLLPIAAVTVGIALLLWGADRFVDGSAAIAKQLRVPTMIIGLTIVSLGTSLPEMLIAAMAAMEGNRNLGVGNVLGSNIANIGLVLGVTALVAPLTIHSRTLRREVPMLLLVTLLAVVLLADNEISLIDGATLLIGMVMILVWISRIALKDRHSPMAEEITDSIPKKLSMGGAILGFIVGLTLLIVSSRIVVWGAVEIAHFLGVSDLVIGLTIVAIGTSLPEMVASIASALKDEADLAIGNVIGSNMFNLLIVLAMPGLIAPGAFSSDVLLRDFPIMLAFTVVFLMFLFGLKVRGRISRPKGGLLVTGFFAYLYLLYIQS